MKKILFTIVGLAISLATLAQDKEKIETNIAADFVSSYIWRGYDLGSTAVQPTLGISYKGLSLSAWGSYGLTDPDDVKELDFTLSYFKEGFNIGVTDYWFSVGADPYGRYFSYSAHSTNHVFEANIGYDFGPLALQWYTNFAGNDGVNNSGKRAYSSYFEASAPFSLAGVSWTATAGVVPWASSMYATTGFAVTNLSLRAVKDIQVTNTFSIPVFGQVVANPRTQHAYLVVGITLQP
ncbi:MAG: hypothetical protein K5856_02990 [Bacteroidaceae bacterium]|nr:hypothetical protein [Bacteroidaceae bacterium]